MLRASDKPEQKSMDDIPLNKLNTQIEHWFQRFCDRNIAFGRAEVRERLREAKRAIKGSGAGSGDGAGTGGVSSGVGGGASASNGAGACIGASTGAGSSASADSGAGSGAGADSGAGSGDGAGKGGACSCVGSLPAAWRDEGEFSSLLELKRAHTLRVVAYAGDIASSLNLPDEDICLSRIIGFLHDIGRFPQLRKHGTFSDSGGENHGKLGVMTMCDEGIDKWFPSSDFEIISTSIIYHNVHVLPDIKDARALTHAKIIRDADKLDILDFITENIGENFYNIEQNAIPGDFDDHLIQDILDHKNLSIKAIKTRADRILFDLSLIFDVYFPLSYEIIKRNSYAEKIVSPYIGQHPAISDIISSTIRYIDERCVQSQ